MNKIVQNPRFIDEPGENLSIYCIIVG